MNPVKHLFPACLFIACSGLVHADVPRTGKEVVNSVCGECHVSGKMGAPKVGDQAAWLKRIADQKGLENLTSNAIRGIRNMPAHGGKGEVTDLEMTRAITYMVTLSSNTPEVAKPYSSPVAMSGKTIVESRCAQCHGEGKHGAPRKGELAEWTPRMAKGLDVMVGNAIRGHNNMPARGGLASLSDAEMRSAAMYLVNTQTF
ncbi:c-type cytochrome [Dechloromonas sp. ZS-1]|uniref:c-type cytochrome n=1 Tax=Dechloromonas sp. ZS-1 TaxID=3138067 RepID=UPI0031FD7CD1